MMRALGYQIGRFKVRSLMKEAGIISKQPGPHRYQTARTERLDIPNHLIGNLTLARQIMSGAVILPIFGQKAAGIIWLWYWIYTVVEWLAGHYRQSRMRI